MSAWFIPNSEVAGEIQLILPLITLILLIEDIHQKMTKVDSRSLFKICVNQRNQWFNFGFRVHWIPLISNFQYPISFPIRGSNSLFAQAIEHGTSTPSLMPWIFFLSAGTMVARQPPKRVSPVESVKK